jgi:hypothetical protein
MNETQIICCGDFLDSYGTRKMVFDFSPEDSMRNNFKKIIMEIYVGWFYLALKEMHVNLKK